MKTKYVALSSPVALGDVVAFSGVPESVDLINGMSMLGTHIGTQEDADEHQRFITGTYNFATNIFTVDNGDLNLVLIDKNLAQIYVDGGNWGLA